MFLVWICWSSAPIYRLNQLRKIICCRSGNVLLCIMHSRFKIQLLLILPVCIVNIHDDSWNILLRFFFISTFQRFHFKRQWLQRIWLIVEYIHQMHIEMTVNWISFCVKIIFIWHFWGKSLDLLYLPTFEQYALDILMFGRMIKKTPLNEKNESQWPLKCHKDYVIAWEISKNIWINWTIIEHNIDSVHVNLFVYYLIRPRRKSSNYYEFISVCLLFRSRICSIGSFSFSQIRDEKKFHRIPFFYLIKQ